MLTRKSLILFAVAATFLAGTASAQPYPSRPVRIVVPQPAGGGVDIYTRLISQKLTQT